MPIMQIGSNRYNYYSDPDRCPRCHHSIHPKFITASLSANISSKGTVADAIYACPRASCSRLFIATYKPDNSLHLQLSHLNPETHKTPEIDTEIIDLSPSFFEIYSQAHSAELYQLNEIAGVGYRKSLEFLIKDYCSQKKPENKETIIASPLGSVIDKFVEDHNIKACAKRAAWLGNDETHYTKKWQDKDLNDLKVLIMLSCNWIKNNILTEKYLNEMS
jgi:hypothetical protein